MSEDTDGLLCTGAPRNNLPHECCWRLSDGSTELDAAKSFNRGGCVSEGWLVAGCVWWVALGAASWRGGVWWVALGAASWRDGAKGSMACIGRPGLVSRCALSGETNAALSDL